ncbi:MAG: hypothetical protein JWQ29_1577 [Phenylobacterium sp.]|nr:hypothetical protein [Phenylobacterium sp.]
MFILQRSLGVLVLSGLLSVGGPALAAEELVVTAGAKTPSVAAQIDDYLKTSPAIDLPRDAAVGITPGDEPRKVHGVVDVAVGSHGYRSAYVRSDFPVGKTGTLSIAVGETQFKGRFGGYGYGGYGGYGDRTYRSQNLALGLAFGGADAEGRCRDGLDGGPRRHRIDPMYAGEDRSEPCERREPSPDLR